MGIPILVINNLRIKAAPWSSEPQNSCDTYRSNGKDYIEEYIWLRKGNVCYSSTQQLSLELSYDNACQVKTWYWTEKQDFDDSEKKKRKGKLFV